MLQTYVGYHPTTSSFARKGAVLRGKEGYHVCGLPMRGRAEDWVGAHASSRGHSVTKSGPAQSMRLTLLHVHVALRHVVALHSCGCSASSRRAVRLTLSSCHLRYVRLLWAMYTKLNSLVPFIALVRRPASVLA